MQNIQSERGLLYFFSRVSLTNLQMVFYYMCHVVMVLEVCITQLYVINSQHSYCIYPLSRAILDRWSMHESDREGKI